MSENETVLRRHVEFEKQWDAAGAASTYHEDGYYENHALGMRLEGRDGVELQYAASYAAIVGMEATYLFEHEDGDRVLQCGRITGRAAANVLGVPTSEGLLDFPFTALITFRDGKMVGEHITYDLEQFCDQAGMDVGAVREAAAAFASG